MWSREQLDRFALGRVYWGYWPHATAALIPMALVAPGVAWFASPTVGVPMLIGVVAWGWGWNCHLFVKNSKTRLGEFRYVIGLFWGFVLLCLELAALGLVVSCVGALASR